MTKTDSCLNSHVESSISTNVADGCKINIFLGSIPSSNMSFLLSETLTSKDIRSFIPQMLINCY